MKSISSLKPEPPHLAFADARAWETWLAAHQNDELGIWMKIAKKDSGIATVDYQQAFRVGLCYGWIDGQKRKCDEQYFLQRFTPRRARSLWSQRNVGIVAELIAAGKMQPRGQQEVDAAQADGRWAVAYKASSKIGVPDDFQAALDADPHAKAFYESLTKTRRYSFLFRITTAKRAETRQRWIDRSIVMLGQGETFN
ncbi:YdeI/OmpD-associated family protein [Cerasicoccus arenae]|uniref:YdeI/OmpD-associated family protein n=1 Tax=Cerasicoccus arenae TaxID=424488 RepID=UPI0019048DD9|nr:YdeI/OmpD-associated family protein [Cerasicoccus arenae]MBK1858624.1 YdeI/OmpD-associated family protein [Cerasicoccus arenae]